MRIKIEISEQQLKDLIVEHLEKKMGDIYFDSKKINIMVKSKQNYKVEWENADFMATLDIEEA
jgi:hypothetical protein